MKIDLRRARKKRSQDGYVLEAIALVAAIAGAAVGAVGAASSAQAQANAANYNSAVEKNNAGAASQQAAFDAQQISDETRRNVASQRAAMAASGFDPNTGTFSDVTSDTKQRGEMNRLMRIYQGKLGINRSTSQAQLDSMNAKNSITAGYFGAGSSILGGVNQATTIASNPNFQH